MKTTSKKAALALLLALPLLAQAHIVLVQPQAPAGSSYVAQLRVGHGCTGAATTAISVQLPEGLRHAKPQPKPGWTLSLRRDAEGRLAEISWTAQNEAAQLQDDWFDDFVLRATLPERSGSLWFKVRQQCVRGEQLWSEVPAEGSDASSLKLPAARLELLPAEPHAGHQH